MGSEIFLSFIVIMTIAMVIDHRIGVHKFKKATKKLRMGDTFIKEISSRNPFEEGFSYTVEVIQVKNGWIKYRCLYTNGEEKIKTDELDRFYRYYIK